MKGLLTIAGFALAGLVAGYFVGVGYACSGENAGNLCGLVGVFITGPIGLIAGLVFALKRLGRPR